jgi:hypothetical protein
MVNYQCYRCGYTILNKTKIIKHLQRITPCKCKYNNITLDQCKEYILQGLTFEEYQKIITNTISPHISTISPHISTISPHISTISPPIVAKLKSTKYECIYCKKSYSRTDSLTRHYKICNDKKTDEDVKDSMNKLVTLLNEQLNEQLNENNKQLKDFKKELTKRDNNFKKELTKRDKELKKEISKRDIQITELIKKAGVNINTTNVMNNIKLLSYSETDRSHLTDKDILKCLKHSNFCIPHLIEKIHFDRKKPENHNVYISNLKNKYVMIYDGSKWICNDREDQINSLIDDNEGIMEYKIEEWVENGNKYPKMMKKFNRYVEIRDNNIVINKIKDEIKLLLYNNRHMVNIQKITDNTKPVEEILLT